VAGIYTEVSEHYNTETRIGVLLNDDVETYASLIAILLLGKTYIPIHPHHPAERINQVIKQSGLRLILSGKEQQLYDNVRYFDVSSLTADPVSLSAPTISIKDDNAYILFTSGSTGIPKGVPITYFNLDSFIDAFISLGYEMSEEDRFLQMFDLTFDLSVMSYLAPLCIGACVYTVSDSGVKFTNIYGVLEQYEISFALMVPSILSHLRPYFNEIALPALKYCLFCGEALYSEIISEWLSCIPNATVENVYGPTEATIFCLTYNIKSKEEIVDWNGIVAIGKPMKNMEAIVIDDNFQIVADGSQGELCLFGSQLTQGYLNAEKTKEAFFILNDKRYYRTGDISYVNNEGNFIYCGRVDNQVKVQGFRIELSEIEFHLRKLTGFSNVVAFAVTTATGLSQIEAVFDTTIQETGEIIEALKTKLPSYMIPSKMHFISPFPLNTNGKTDRKELKKLIN